MPSSKPIFTIRAEKELFEKIAYIAKENERSTNAEIVYQLKKIVAVYELKNGEIKID